MQIQHLIASIIILISHFLCGWACTPNERRALLSLKAGLTDHHGRLSSWQGNEDCCTWKGIGCARKSNATHVPMLNLRNPNPQHLFRSSNGKILALTSDSWSLNDTWEYLDLSWNDFHKSKIPEQLGNLHGLKDLNLWNAKFSGAIPNKLSNLSALQTLDLSCSSRIPESSSISVNVSTNKIIHDNPYSYFSSGLLNSHQLSWFERLNDLRVLILDGVDLSIASSAKQNDWAKPLTFLSKLEFLNLSYCGISDITNSRLTGYTPHLSWIEWLYAGGNRDLSINLPHFSLVKLSLSNNNIQGRIPPYLINLSNLDYIDLSYNSLMGTIPLSLSNIGKLQFLNSYQNKFEGQISETLCDHFSLEILELRLNKLSGRNARCIGNLSKLDTFEVSFNSFKGTVSLPSLFANASPRTVGLYFSGLSVSLHHMEPTSFRPMNLWLASCNLQGKIPDFISKLKNIQVLFLQNNKLSGTILSWLWKLPRLSTLDLSNNNLYGTLCYGLDLLNDLAISYMHSGVNLANNRLHGNVLLPSHNIEIFYLSHNNFNGSISITPHNIEIPLSLNNGIMSLNLSQKLFSGTIPSALGNCTSLIALNLADNNLIGGVPVELGNAKKLKALHVDNNYLNWSFPKVIQELNGMEFLNLGYNFFNRIIPPFMGNLSDLCAVLLTSNDFSGSIPTKITGLHRLQFLDLSNNKLEGTIPSKLNNFETLIKQTPTLLIGYLIDLVFLNLNMEFSTKGMRLNLIKVYSYHTGMDPSNNDLDELYMLNLSRNNLVGQIPESIENLTNLESLDLSQNQLSGQIPNALIKIDSLGWMNVSYNRLSGKIPSSPHFDTLTLDPFVFSGNPLLSWEEHMVLVYLTGLWEVFVVLALKKEWRVKYWDIAEEMVERTMSCFGHQQAMPRENIHTGL
ncbi:hypothetical protein AMTRI_Chr03g45900 [Amborella trichopoda]